MLFTLLVLSLSVLSAGSTNEQSGVFNYTSQEREALNRFRSMVQSQLYKKFMEKDEFLYRFLIDQNFNLEHAKQKLVNSLNWRKVNNIDSLTNDNTDTLRNLCPFLLDGIDKIGRPVMTFDIGKCSVRKIVLRGKAEELHRFSFYYMEAAYRAIEEQQESGKNISDFIIIADYNGFNLREHGCVSCIPHITRVLTVYDAYYPRLIYKIIGVNAPKAFTRFFELMRPFMSEYLQNNYHIFGVDKTEWKKRILELVDPGQLLIQFGGTKSP